MVILDRDGTVIEDRDYLSDPAGVKLLPGTAEGLRLLADSGYGLIVISNQSGVGRGYFTMREVEAVNGEIERQLAAHGIKLAGIYVCPHAPEDRCTCRKPATGLLVRAAGETGFDPSRSVVIGDKISDLEMGRAVGALTVLVQTGKGGAEAEKLTDQADIVASDLKQAAESIIERQRGN